jgi:hypothetical protein
MDRSDRQAIEELFDRLANYERKAPPRDPEAEAFIGSAIRHQPAAPYYMAQTIIVQQQALDDAQRRIAELEGRAASAAPRREPRFNERDAGPWGRSNGFLAGAAQTAMGVAGGVLLGNLIGGMLFGDQAHAQEQAGHDDPGADDAGADADSDFGDFGDLDGGFDL